MGQEFKVKNGLIVSGSADIEQDLRVRGTLTVDELHTSITTSSILYESGSTRFGDSLDDTHELTGSVSITGSISLNGEPIGTGKLDETTFYNYTSSNDDRVDSLETESGSIRTDFNLFTSSYTTGTFTGSFVGDGSELYNIPASGVTGLNLSQISTGSVVAALSPEGFNINTDTSITGSLNISGTIVSQTTTLVSGSPQIDITSTTGYASFSSSIATTDLSQENRILSIENKTGSYATTGSNLFIGTQTHSGSILPSVDNAYDLGSVEYQWRDVYISSGSLYIDGTKVISSTAQELVITTDTGQSIKILEGTTDSIVLQTADGDIELKSSADGDILLDPTNGKIMLKGPVEILSGQKIQSSVGGTPVVFANDIVVSGSIDITGTIEGIDLTAFSSSINTRLTNLENSGASINSFTSSIDTTIKNKLNSDGVISGSIQVDITNTTNYTTFSSSISSSISGVYDNLTVLSGAFTTTDDNHENRLDVIESRYATTGSNIFKGDQTITGSLYISQNLIVQGSSSLENITASAVSIGTNTIILNADTPAIRYAGISVFDSGSTNVTASLFYDSLTNNWKFKHSDVGTNDASIFIYGPLGSDIDNTPTLVGNYITKVEDNGHGHHITTSSIFDNGSIVSIKSNTDVTGSLIVTGPITSNTSTLVSGSSQISFNGIVDKPTLVSGSSQISFNGITDKPTLVSGSSQISYSGLSNIPAGIVSGSSQISYTGLSNIPNGIISGSIQVDLTATTNYSSGIKTRLNAEGVLSGSAQVVAALPAGTVSGSAQLTSTFVQKAGDTMTGTLTVNTNANQVAYFQSPNANTWVDIISTAGTWSMGATSSNTWAIYERGSANATRFSVGSSTATLYGNTVWHAGNDGASSGLDADLLDGQQGTYYAAASSLSNYLPLAGGTMSGIITTVSSGTAINFSGQSDSFGYNASSGLGTYIKGTGSTYIYGGGAFYDGSTSRTLLHSGNFTSYAMAGAGYSANQNLNTSNSPTFAGLTINSGGNYPVISTSTQRYFYQARNTSNSINSNYGWWWFMDTNFNMGFHADGAADRLTLTRDGNLTVTGGGTFGGSVSVSGIGTFSSSSDHQIALVSPDTWAGIQFDDTNSSPDYIWYHGGSQTFAIGGGGSNVGGKKLHVHGGMTVGTGLVSTSTASNGLSVEGTIKGANYFDAQANSGFRIRNSNDSGNVGGFTRRGLWEGNSNYDPAIWAETGYSFMVYTNGSADIRAYWNTAGHLLPGANNTYDLGSSSLGWRNVYTNDLHLSNMNKPEGNDIDGTKGNWTIQEGAENLYIINNNNGKKFKISLEEV